MKEIANAVIRKALIACASLVVIGYPFMIVWNKVVVPTFNVVSEVNYAQAVCLLTLFQLIKPCVTVRQMNVPSIPSDVLDRIKGNTRGEE